MVQFRDRKQNGGYQGPKEGGTESHFLKGIVSGLEDEKALETNGGDGSMTV